MRCPKWLQCRCDNQRRRMFKRGLEQIYAKHGDGMPECHRRMDESMASELEHLGYDVSRFRNIIKNY